MKIAVASDHAGFELKEIIKRHLNDRKIETIDLGTHSEESVDYPLYGQACAEAVAEGKAELGVVCCGTGIGISIAANKVHGIRCAVVTEEIGADRAKRHNNVNILALGGRVLSAEKAVKLLDIWLDTEFEGGRHQRRVDEIDQM